MPNTVTEPPASFWTPTSARISVDLPHPDGPEQTGDPATDREVEGAQHLAPAAHDDQVVHLHRVFHHVMNYACDGGRGQGDRFTAQAVNLMLLS